MSAGPLYHYLIAPLIALTGPSYFGIKLASVVVSLAALAMTYLLVRRLADDRVALVSLFITGVSSWLLIFSRLGNVQVLSPLLILVPLYFLVRHLQRGGIANLIACAATAPLGLYCMPQTFIHAPVVFAVLLVVRFSQRRIRIGELAVFVAVAALLALPMVLIVAMDPDNFFSGYIGGKLDADAPLETLLGNVKRALLAFHWRGDGINRSNPPLLPHLDPVSGGLMLLGFVFWLRRPYRQWAPVILMPFFLLLVPSMLVLHSPHEVPSASRTLAAAPFACMLAAGGLWLPAQLPRAQATALGRRGVGGADPHRHPGAQRRSLLRSVSGGAAVPEHPDRAPGARLHRAPPARHPSPSGGMLLGVEHARAQGHRVRARSRPQADLLALSQRVRLPAARRPFRGQRW